MMRQFLYNCVTLAVIVDPVGTSAIFAGLAAGHTAAFRRSMALRGTAVAFGLALFFAFSGEFLLRALGVTLPAFQVAGGALLFLLATDMVFARHHTGLRETTDAETREAEQSADISVFPLAVPLLAGPGCLTSIVLLMRQAEGSAAAEALVVLALAVVMLAALVSLLVAGRLVAVLGVTGINVVSRVLGIILTALAAELLLSGIRAALFAPQG